MRQQIINWLKSHGIVYQEDFIEIIYFLKYGDCKLIFDIDNDELSMIDYDYKGNILEKTILDTDKKLTEAIEIFEICEN